MIVCPGLGGRTSLMCALLLVRTRCGVHRDWWKRHPPMSRRLVLSASSLAPSRGTSLFLASAINAFGAGMFFPFALLYYQDVTSLSVSTIGLVLTAATVLTLAMTPIAGSLVDRFGARRIVVIGQIIEAVGFVGYLAVTSPATLLGAALLATAGTRMFYTAFSTLIAERVSGPERDRWYGIVSVTQSVGGSISGLAAALVIGGLGNAGFRTVIALNIGCLLLSAWLIGRDGLPGVARSVDRSNDGADGYRAVLREPLYLRLVLVNAGCMLCSMLPGLALVVYGVQALGLPLWSISAAGFMQTALVIGGQARLTGRLAEVRRTRAMSWACGGWVIACLVLGGAAWLPASGRFVGLLLGAMVFTGAQMAYGPASRALAAQLAPESARGRFVATFEFSYGVAAAAGPGVFGVLYDIDARAPWLVMPLIVVSAALMLRQVERDIDPAHNVPQLSG